jgi:hypothetical protein
VTPFGICVLQSTAPSCRRDPNIGHHGLGRKGKMKRASPAPSYQSRTLPYWAELRAERFMPRIISCGGAMAGVRLHSRQALQMAAAHKKTPAKGKHSL